MSRRQRGRHRAAPSSNPHRVLALAATAYLPLIAAAATGLG